MKKMKQSLYHQLTGEQYGTIQNIRQTYNADLNGTDTYSAICEYLRNVLA